MTLVDIDSWLTEFDACERLSSDIQSNIVLRNQQPQLSSEYSRISTGIRFKLTQFTTQLEQLNVNLKYAFNRGTITEQEAERRQRQIEVLQSNLTRLKSQFRSVDDEKSRSELFQARQKQSLWENDNDDDDDEPIIRNDRPTDSSNYSVEDFRKQQAQMLQNQDRGLDALSQVISRQKRLATQIGTEVEDQNEIIGGLAVAMENTDSHVNSQTRNVNSVLRTDSTKGYWFIIICLFIAILIVQLAL